jgi:hypothetical protein
VQRPGRRAPIDRVHDDRPLAVGQPRQQEQAGGATLDDLDAVARRIVALLQTADGVDAHAVVGAEDVPEPEDGHARDQRSSSSP